MKISTLQFSTGKKKLTSLSERYMSNQFENIRSTDPSEIYKFGEVTSAHMNLTFLWCPLMLSFCIKMMWDEKLRSLLVNTSLFFFSG